MTQTERRKLINNLLLSTATVVKDSDGNMISPRKQGAGLANLKAAVQTGAYLTDKNGNKPVISLGDSQSGDFEFSFLLKRLKASHNDYKVSVSAFTEKVKTVDGKAYIAQQPRKLSDDELITPTIAAALLRYREGGMTAVRQLFLRILDYRRIKRAAYLWTAILLFPTLYLFTYLAIRQTGQSIPTHIPLQISLLGAFIMFFIAAIAEELGYAAYATESLQRYFTPQASIRKFAKQQGIHAGIVVGRLKNDRVLPFSAMQDMHSKIIVQSDGD